MYAEVNRAVSLKVYVNNPKIHARVGVGYKVRMGFGLHYGWGIEGAIGSHHKVDVSYLSPNVNMSGRLEEKTKSYGVPMLLSGEFVDRLSDDVKKYCRMIDVIHIKGNPVPLRLYTPFITDKAIKFPKVDAMSYFKQPTKECYNFKKMVKIVM
jgi:class 3 adenylate cyclase